MSITPKPKQPLFRSLGPDNSKLDASTKAAAKEAEQRWPLFQSLAPTKSITTAPLSDADKSVWKIDRAPAATQRKSVLSRPSLPNQMADSLEKFNPTVPATAAAPTPAPKQTAPLHHSNIDDAPVETIEPVFDIAPVEPIEPIEPVTSFVPQAEHRTVQLEQTSADTAENPEAPDAPVLHAPPEAHSAVSAALGASEPLATSTTHSAPVPPVPPVLAPTVPEQPKSWGLFAAPATEPETEPAPSNSLKQLFRRLEGLPEPVTSASASPTARSFMRRIGKR